jgi:hypothetical protein
VLVAASVVLPSSIGAFAVLASLQWTYWLGVSWVVIDLVAVGAVAMLHRRKVEPVEQAFRRRFGRRDEATS